jgi:hypothetical protein
MKLVGFISQYNDIDEALSLDRVIDGKMDVYVDQKAVLGYLKSGHLLMAWMGYFIDVRTRELIAPDTYYTDGLWVWPSYFPYYLEKYPDMYINNEFLNYVRDKNFVFKVDDLFEKKKKSYEEELSNRLSVT